MFEKRTKPITSRISVVDYVLETYLPAEETINVIQEQIIPELTKEGKKAWVRVNSVLTSETFLVSSTKVYKMLEKNQVTDKKFQEVLKDLE